MFIKTTISSLFWIGSLWLQSICYTSLIIKARDTHRTNRSKVKTTIPKQLSLPVPINNSCLFVKFSFQFFLSNDCTYKYYSNIFFRHDRTLIDSKIKIHRFELVPTSTFHWYSFILLINSTVRDCTVNCNKILVIRSISIIVIAHQNWFNLPHSAMVVFNKCNSVRRNNSEPVMMKEKYSRAQVRTFSAKTEVEIHGSMKLENHSNVTQCNAHMNIFWLAEVAIHDVCFHWIGFFPIKAVKFSVRLFITINFMPRSYANYIDFTK